MPPTGPLSALPIVEPDWQVPPVVAPWVENRRPGEPLLCDTVPCPESMRGVAPNLQLVTEGP